MNPEYKVVIQQFPEKYSRRLSVSMGMTINIGDYSSLKAEAGISEDLPDGIPLDDGFKALWNEVAYELDRALRAQAVRFKAKRQKLLRIIHTQEDTNDDDK